MRSVAFWRAAAGLWLVLAGPAAGREAVTPGRYVLDATAKVDATGLSRRELAAKVLALVGPGDRPSSVRMRLAAHGYDCDLSANVDRRGELSLDPGQTCPLVLDAPDARGRVEARLRSGRGTLRGDELALELAWDLAGTVSTSMSGKGVRVPGTSVEVPPVWTPEVPIRGTADATARGRREELPGADAAATGRRSP